MRDDAFSELRNALEDINRILRSIDPEIGLVGIEIRGGREAAIALRGALAASPKHPTQSYRSSPLLKKIGGVILIIKTNDER